LPACVARVDQYHGDAFQGCLVADQFCNSAKPQLAILARWCLLALTRLRMPRSLRGQSGTGRVRHRRRWFCSGRGWYGAGSAPKRTLWRNRCRALQSPASGMLAAHIVDLRECDGGQGSAARREGAAIMGIATPRFRKSTPPAGSRGLRQGTRADVTVGLTDQPHHPDLSTQC
jgi:hypothetical protein